MARNAQKVGRTGPERTVVLMSPGASLSDDNPFVSLLVDHLPTDIEVRPFGWLRAFFSRYDVLHVHWPDHILKASSPAKAGVKEALFLALLLRNRLLAHHVRTVHNVSPHEGGSRLNRAALALWEKSCAVSVYLSDAGRGAAPGPRFRGQDVTIVHGDYSPFVEKLNRPMTDPIPGRLLAFGYLRPYKGIEQLVASFRQTDASTGLSLKIVGPALPASYGEAVRQLCQGDDRIEVVIGRQRDADLVDEIMQASAIVLPYKQVYNSGAALMALTLRRPILVTDSETMGELATEVGEKWVRRVAHWDGAALLEASSDLPPASSSPVLGGRAWPALSARYAEIYRFVSRPRSLGRGHRPNTAN